jgi:hypothetical protein
MPPSIFYLQGQEDALLKLGARVLPPIRTKIRSEHEPIKQEKPWEPPKTPNPFDKVDARDPRKPRRKAAAFTNIMKSMNGAKPLTNFPSGASQMIKAPKPQQALGPQVKAPQLKGAIDPRASKPAGMNLQHQVQDNAHTFDVGNSMSSPNRRFVSPL